MNAYEIFCRQIRARSDENRKAVSLLYNERLLSQIISVLRQELDSMIRVIYLLHQDTDYQSELLQASIEGKQWKTKDGKKKITDREMVELADSLHGWTKSVYKFGCAFIHLSSFHDYKSRDPMEMISSEERDSVLEHMRYYHGGPITDSPTITDIAPYLPRVFHKIADNLECYVKDLESNQGFGTGDLGSLD